MTHPVDRLLRNLAAGGMRPCLFENGRWHSAGELAAAVCDWRAVLAVRAVRPGTVLGLQASFSFDAVACLLAAWELRAIVALLPPAASTEEAGALAHCDLVL